MTHIVFFAPHPDDETLSAGLALTWYLSQGATVDVVAMTRGEAGGPLGSFNGNNVCNWAPHSYTHNPTAEGYTALTSTDLGAARVHEGRSAVGAMAMIAPSSGVSAGTIAYHEGGSTGVLPDGFGTQSDGVGKDSPTAVALAKAIISEYVNMYSNTFFYTMSPTDDHPDHAACGQALRDLKNTNPLLSGVRFFVSKRYWAVNNGGSYPADVAAQPDLQWFNAGTRKSDIDAHLRGKVINCFQAWNPAEGSYAIGYHQVAGQFADCFGPSVSVANLWHA
jgi:LmbE family N-acetylglucosaminyl deacetylase